MEADGEYRYRVMLLKNLLILCVVFGSLFEEIGSLFCWLEILFDIFLPVLVFFY